MSVQIHNKSLKELCPTDNYTCYDWIANNEYGIGNEGEEKVLCDNRDEIFVIGTIDDDHATYDYNDWALITLNGQFYLLSTSGCSCPSPKETWHIQIGPTTKEEVKKFIEEGEYGGYTMPKRQLNQFLELFK